MYRTTIALTCSLVFIATAAFAHTLTVPFFRDNGGLIDLNTGLPPNGAAGFIGVKNNTNSDISAALVYVQDVDGVPTIQAAKPFVFPAHSGVSWRPVADDPAEGVGQAVPNVDEDSGFTGSLQVVWAGGDLGGLSLQGRYVEITQGGSFAYLLPNVP